MDEFGKQSRVGQQRKGVFPKGWRDACKRVGAGDRQSFTGISCNNAAGESVPLTFIFKGQWRSGPNQEAIVAELSKPTAHLPDGWGSAVWQAESHMMTQDYFLSWIDWFVEKTGASVDDPVLLALDGHSSRMSLLVWEECLKRGVHLFIFPGGITSHIQPQDVGVLGGFTKTLNKMYSTYCKEETAPLTTLIFLGMIRDAWQKSVDVTVIRKAWDKSGLETINGGSDKTRLFPAIKMASPHTNEALLSDPDKAFFQAALCAPLPCPDANDLRASAPLALDGAAFARLRPHQQKLLKLNEQLTMPKYYKDKARQAAEQKKAERAATTTNTGWKKREKEIHIESRMHMHARFINKKVQ